MVPSDAGSPESEPAPADITVPPNGGDAAPDRENHGRLVSLTIAAGLIASVVSFLAGEVIMKRYESDLLPTLKISPSPEDIQRWRGAQLYSATFTYLSMGGLFGLAMGLAGGLGRRSVAAGIKAAVLGLMLGGAAAACVALVVVPIFHQRRDPQSVDLVIPLLTHGAMWLTVGACGGLALGLGLGGRGRWAAALAGAMGGAAVATIVYEIVGAIAFASNRTDLPVSSSVATRGMAQLLVATLAAAGATTALGQSAKRKP
jgi:hypothetical protein